jgi:predicted RNase H-like HicB family nuclease
LNATSTTPSLAFSVGLEEGPDGAALVHCLSLPGCVAGGGSRQEALASFERVLSQWLTTLGSLGEPLPPADAELEIVVDEWVRTEADVASGESSALFQADEVPLPPEESERLLQRLGDLRGHLLARVRRLPEAELDRPWRDSWTARLALEELARAHWWTLSRLGASSMAEVPARTLARLDTAMALVVQRFTGLSVQERERVIEIEGERWSPRKVLRRLLWLEWTFGRIALAALNDQEGER